MDKRLSLVTSFVCAGLLLFQACGGGSENSPAPVVVTRTISGTITYGGAASAAVGVTLSGSRSSTTTTDASGNYSFSSLSSGTYTITPSKAGYIFNPSSLSADLTSSSATGKNFQALLVPAPTSWDRTYDGGGAGGAGEAARSIRQTYDGGYVVAGYTTSFGQGNEDLLLMRLGTDGSVAWQKTYGGTGFDRAYAVQETPDSGYIIAGKTDSFGAGSYDFWLIKTTSTGTISWQKTFGGVLGESDSSVVINSDGTYTIAGDTESIGAGMEDIWVAKLSASGSIVWQKTYGSNQSERNASLASTSDGGYILAADSTSFGGASRDIWLIKLDGSGSIQWQKAYGNGGENIEPTVQQTSDGGYIISCYGLFPSVISWVFKVDSTGTLVWAKEFGGSGYETKIYSVSETSDQGIVVGGYNLNAGNYSKWAAKLTSSGNVTWQKDYQADAVTKWIYAIYQSRDGGYVMAGLDESIIGIPYKLSIMKTDSNGDIASCGIDMPATSPAATPVITTATTSVSPATATLEAASTSVSPQDSNLTLTTVCSP